MIKTEVKIEKNAVWMLTECSGMDSLWCYLSTLILEDIFLKVATSMLPCYSKSEA